MAYNKKAHLRDNIEAIRLMFRLERERRAATPEEQTVLAAYTGFGGIKAVLSPFGKLTDILRSLCRNCMACSARGRRMNGNTNGWWTV